MNEWSPNISVTFKIDRKGNFIVDYSMPEPGSVLESEKIAEHLANILNSVHHSSSLADSLIYLQQTCKRKVQPYIYNNTIKKLSEIKHAENNDSEVIILPNEVFR